MISAQEITNTKMSRKHKTLLDKMLTTRTITPDGLLWLTQALDPFHDTEVTCAGFPDLTTSRCVNQTLTFTTNVTRPSTVPATDNWDCHVFFNPATPPITMLLPGIGPDGTDHRLYRHNLNPFGVTDNPNLLNYIVPGFNAISVSSNADWISAAVVSSTSDLKFPTKYCSGFFRIVAAGYEVVNTTASLYKGGSVTSYRSPGNSFSSNLLNVSSENVLSHLASTPPSTQQQAALYPDSKTWSADRGVYGICTLNSQDVPYVTPIPGSQGGLIRNADINYLTTGANPSRIVYLPRDTTHYTSGANTVLPFDISGSILTGLHPNSALQITVRYVVERVPTITESDLLPLARPPASYDPVSLELYTHIITRLPMYCPVDDNPDGEWWESLLDALSAIAPVAGAVLAPLTGGASVPIAAAVTGASQAAKALAKNRSPAAKAASASVASSKPAPKSHPKQ